MSIAKWIQLKNIDTTIEFYLYSQNIEPQDKARQILQERSSSPVTIVDLNKISCIYWNTLIIDMLNTPISLMKILKNNSNMLVSIDNISSSRRLSDININPLYYNFLEKYNTYYDYIGPQFQIISPEYSHLKSVWRENVKNILVIQGGADPFGITCKIIDEITPILYKYKKVTIHLVIGPAAIQKCISLIDLKGYQDRIKIHYNLNNMPSFLKNIDLVVTSIGVTAFEVSSMGIPAIHITGVQKEKSTGVIMNNLGVSIFLGLYNDIEKGELRSKLIKIIGNNDMRKKMRDSCFKLFDQNNSKEIVELILHKANKVL
jgi:spore coat polysaccharide biosynthesis predicted glycosyltransferase SpsG